MARRGVLPRFLLAAVFAIAVDGGAAELDVDVHALADQGYAVAQMYLGLKYDLGEGVAQDLVFAARYYRMAAEQGLADAQLYLGAAYLDGRGVTADAAVAQMWLDRALIQLTGDDRELAAELRHRAQRGRVRRR